MTKVLGCKHGSGCAIHLAIIEHVIDGVFQDESVEILSGAKPKFESTLCEILSM